MSREHRDYAGEYRRRIQRGLNRNWSRSKARGHGRPRRPAVKASPQVYGPEFDKALKALPLFDNLQLAAKSASVSPRRFRRFLREKRLAHFKRTKWKGSGRRWNITDQRPRQMTIISTTGIRDVWVKGRVRASWVGSHLNAVKQYLAAPDKTLLEPYEGKSITDTSDRQHFFETRPNTLYRLLSAEGDNFLEVYRLIT
jgi:hypothetical protein